MRVQRVHYSLNVKGLTCFTASAKIEYPTPELIKRLRTAILALPVRMARRMRHWWEPFHYFFIPVCQSDVRATSIFKKLQYLPLPDYYSIMALKYNGDDPKLAATLAQQPKVTIFLRPIAPPAALGLAGFAGSTWIASSWIANWWGNDQSPTIFFPFVAFWGGLAQFIAGLFGFIARDTLVTVINTMWGSFWMSIGLLYLLVVRIRILSALEREGANVRFKGEWHTR